MSSTPLRTVDVLSRLHRVTGVLPTPYQRGHKARCPACNGPEKLRVISDIDGKVQLVCRANCRKSEIVAALNGDRKVSKTSPKAKAKQRKKKRKPKVYMPGGKHGITDTAGKLGKLLAGTGEYFRRGGTVVKKGLDDNSELVLRPVVAASLPSIFETVASIVVEKNGRPEPAIFNRTSAELILKANAFIHCLPRITILSACPLLLESDGKLKVVTGYDAESGVLARGDEPLDLSLDEARQLLFELLADFNFVTPSDRSRALAALVTPALIMGDLLKGRAPVDLGEADLSQSGKGYRNKLTAAMYQAPLVSITQRPGRGVGSMEENFDRALFDGRPFIALDNMRGKIDSPAIESFLTEDVYMTRSAYLPPTEICPRRVVLMLTSNKAEVTPDLANRSSICRILKQSDDYNYREFAEGDLLAHLRANQSKYLAAVFAVIKAWHEAGKPSTNPKGHDFRRWAGVMDWIVQNLFQAAPLLGGHRKAQKRVANPHLNWLREVALAVIRGRRTGDWLRASAIMDILDDAGVEIPGVKEGQTIDDDGVHKVARQQIGRRPSKCFVAVEPHPPDLPSNMDLIAIDGSVIERQKRADSNGNFSHVYRFSSNDCPSPSNGPSNGSSNKTPVPSNKSNGIELFFAVVQYKKTRVTH